jgi:hypothetical protein
MFEHSVRKWIPEGIIDKELIKQFADAVDWLLSMDYPYSDEVTQSFYAVRDKYKNPQNIPLQDVYAILEESGYKYITDTLDLSEDGLRTFISFLNFIHINKGTRKGLEFALRLLNVEYSISEWFEQDPQGEQHTFDIDLLSFSPDNVKGGFEIVDRIVAFTRNYVYPILKRLNLEFKFNTLILNVCGVYQSTQVVTFYPDTPWMIWDVHGWNQKWWYYGTPDLIYNVTEWDNSRWSGAH